MSIFQITFFLSLSCLGEITPNFRRIYWVAENKLITLFFFLEKEIEEDAENIEDEIMAEFSIYIEGEPSLDDYQITSKIIYGENKYLSQSNFDTFVEFYRRKENVE